MTDQERHLEKIMIALKQCDSYFSRTSEANAALHGSERVLYSPICTTISEALQSVEFLKAGNDD